MTDSRPRSTSWAVALLLVLHNAEEALTMPRFVPVARSLAPQAMRPAIDGLSSVSIYIALTMVTVLPLSIALWNVRRPASRWAPWALAVVQAVVGINTLWHLAIAVRHGGYVPGLATALTLNLPFSIYFFREARRQRWMTDGGLWSVVPAAVLLHGPGLFALMAVARSVAGAFGSAR